MTPAEIDLEGFAPFASKFGCHEFEQALVEIVRFIRDLPKEPTESTPWQFRPMVWGRGEGWAVKFCIGEIPAVRPEVFVALAYSHWIEHVWFPKWSFCLTAPAIERICRPRIIVK